VQPLLRSALKCAFMSAPLDVADVPWSERRQLSFRLGQETDLQLRLILLQSAFSAIVGAAIFQKQIRHLVEGLALSASTVFAVLLAFANLRSSAFASCRVPRTVCQSFFFCSLL